MLSVTCPSCAKKLQVKDELAGKKVKCPGCQTVLALPAAKPKAEARRPEPEEPDTEETEQAAAVPSKRARAERPMRKTVPPADEDEEDEDNRPAAKTRRRAKGEEEEDADDRPARSKPAKKKPGGRAWLIAIPVVLLLVCGGGLFGGYLSLRHLWNKGVQEVNPSLAQLSSNMATNPSSQPSGATTGATDAATALAGKARDLLGPWSATDQEFNGWTLDFKDNGTYTLSVRGSPPDTGGFHSIDNDTIDLSGPLPAKMKVAVAGKTMTLTNLATHGDMHFARPDAMPTPPALTGVAQAIVGKWYSPDFNGGSSLEFKADGTYTANVRGQVYNGTFQSVDRDTVNFSPPIWGQMKVTVTGDDATATGGISGQTIHMHRGDKPATPAPPTTPAMSPGEIRQMIVGKWHSKDFPPAGLDVEFRSNGSDTLKEGNMAESVGSYQVNDDGTLHTGPPLSKQGQMTIALNGPNAMVLTDSGAGAPSYHFERVTTTAAAPPKPSPTAKSPTQDESAKTEQEADRELQAAKKAHEDFTHKLQVLNGMAREKNLARLQKARTEALQAQQHAAQLLGQVIQKYPTTKAAQEAQLLLAQMQQGG